MPAVTVLECLSVESGACAGSAAQRPYVMPTDNRTKLIRNIMRQYDAGAEYPLVGVEEFFTGNTDTGSLAPNLGDDHPGMEKFAAVFRGILKRDDVSDVVLAIHECPEPDEEADADIWPFAENVHVITSASAKELEGWVAELKCDGVSDGWLYGEPENSPKIPKGYGVRTLSWD